MEKSGAPLMGCGEEWGSRGSWGIDTGASVLEPGRKELEWVLAFRVCLYF